MEYATSSPLAGVRGLTRLDVRLAQHVRDERVAGAASEVLLELGTGEGVVASRYARSPDSLSAVSERRQPAEDRMAAPAASCCDAAAGGTNQTG